MRTLKEPEVRKNEILDAAASLFAEKGFDDTSTNNILGKAGIARGTLYYHFKSKEDIMDALIERINTRLLSAAEEIASNKSIPVLERLLQAVLALNAGEQGAGVLEYAHRPQNALMHQKMERAMINGIPPILSKIIEDGIEEGIFHTPYPCESIEMIICTVNTILDEDMLALSEEGRIKKIMAIAFNIERLLGMESGSFTNVMAMFGREGKNEQG